VLSVGRTVLLDDAIDAAEAVFLFLVFFSIGKRAGVLVEG